MSFYKIGFLLILGFLLPLMLFSQNKQAFPSLNIKKSGTAITVDGVLDETAWKEADLAKGFYQCYPSDTCFSTTKTEVRVTYDDKYFYVGAVCYDSLPGDYVIQSLKRDFSYEVSDAFAVYIDPFNDKTNGFGFAVSPLGVQYEGLLQNGASRGVSTEWDNKWFSEVKIADNKWIVEMAIPFKSIRYKNGVKKWGINFSRNDLKRNENSVWSSVPQNFNTASLAFTGELLWDTPPEKAGSNVSVIPYATSGMNQNHVANTPVDYAANIGFDAKIAVSSSLNLDVTFNPDFSQVEVDRQQTNLTRFSLFFPERRQFFIENSDLFSNFGFSQIRPFFSRRVGLNEPITGGARLSGKINNNWRVGLMTVQTAKSDLISFLDTERKAQLDINFSNSNNYTVAAVQRQVFKSSNIAAIFVNKQGYDNNKLNHSDYNRIVGLDYNLASADNNWRGKAFFHKSFTPQQLTNSYAHASWLMYSDKKIFSMWNHEYVGDNYIAEVGFVPRSSLFNPESETIIRRTYWRLEPMFYYKFFPESNIVLNHGPGIYFSQYMDKDLNTTDYILQPKYEVNFINTSRLEVQVQENFTRLFFQRDVTNSGIKTIPRGDYTYHNAVIRYNSDRRKILQQTAFFDYGTFYNGVKATYGAEVSYRVQPWGIFSVNYNQSDIRFPQPYQDVSIILLGPKIELSLTKGFFFTTFLQYNTQMDNFNVNSRVQWRFKPLSDLYVVYTDNYDAFLNTKSKALVVKLVYWLTI